MEPMTKSATVMMKMEASDTKALRQKPTKPERIIRLKVVHMVGFS